MRPEKGELSNRHAFRVLGETFHERGSDLGDVANNSHYGVNSKRGGNLINAIVHAFLDYHSPNDRYRLSLQSVPRMPLA